MVLATGLSPSLVADEPSTALRSAFKARCIKCHGEGGKVKGKVDLLALKSERDLLAKPELLETLLEVLKDREMPPKDEPLLPESKRMQMVGQVEAMLRATLKTQAFEPTPIRRMNRFQ